VALTAPPEILTDRLVVRLATSGDLPDLLAVNGDDAVTRYLPYPTWESLADAQAWYERMQGVQACGTALQFVVQERSGKRVVGSCLLFRLEQASARAELGYVLGRVHWGRGYMQEALDALLGVAFTQLGLRRVEAEVNPANHASLRLLERLGFRKEGLLRQRWVAKGQTYDVVAHGLLRDEYVPRSTAPDDA
jgi:[ribosomal protein S5]-alanine N-acetyltransferase